MRRGRLIRRTPNTVRAIRFETKGTKTESQSDSKEQERNVKKYIVLYYASAAAIEQTQDFSPEDMQKGMELWKAWMDSCGDGLVDVGTPLGGGLKLTRAGGTPTDSGVTGYSILQAEDMESVQKLLVGHPHLDWAPGCEIAVHESMPMPI